MHEVYKGKLIFIRDLFQLPQDEIISVVAEASEPPAVREAGMVRKGESSGALLRTLADALRWRSFRALAMVCSGLVNVKSSQTFN
ncbi:jg19824 [Pararge aegeria aegeria]|uniref:Jg19824 protein n=1 Tax=Pararge aegeria aegeria TaxID=348720 RepID=A0A8S4SHC5_9NEOP|nr:jg19824 [Pararge aegeria aegeria]